ncbi:MAG TPA: sulfotransferase [Sphingomicrobium sp.]|jgi:tetratricopeptide (TPR) repeat protein
MTEDEVKQKVLAALGRLRVGERDEAAALIAEAVHKGPPTGAQWKSIGKLCGQIGEIELAVEAMRKYAATAPLMLSRQLDYWKDLTIFGRTDVVEKEITRLGNQVAYHPAVLHVRGQMAAQDGDFEAATALHLRVVQDPELAAQGWFSLSTITNMSKHPDWIDQMLAVERAGRSSDPSAQSRLLYGLGKAFHDCGDYARAMDCYSRGAAARRSEAQYNPQQLEAFAVAAIREFTPAALEALRPAEYRPRASIFVNGLPRSGTTLVEQILVAHSEVHDGAEVNLARAALIPALDYRYAGALAYDRKAEAGSDPWGTIGAQYQRMLSMRFRTDALVVDKSLTQSHIMGLIRHALAGCPVIWMRRNLADVAISCYRTLFTSPLAWCWRFADMGHFFAVEDALFTHWSKVLGDGILAVDYQELVHDPSPMIRRIASHAGLPWEDAMEQFHTKKRAVRTASLQQVRQPITTKAIGQAEPYAPWMGDFWRAYETTSDRLAKELASAA